MNYIERLQSAVTDLEYARQCALEEIAYIRQYLNLPKFKSDPYVHKNDIFARLNNVVSALNSTKLDTDTVTNNIKSKIIPVVK